MKYAIFLLCIFYSSLACASENQIPQIHVTGVASENVAPDELRWFLRVKNAGKLVSEVADNHVGHVNAVLKYLKEQKLAEKDIRTSQMQLQENWVYRGNSQVKEGYFASTSITFVSRDFAQYTAIWKTLSSIDKVAIDSVNFGLSNFDSLQEKLRVQALLNAKAQAVEMAKALGASIGEPLLISDHNRPGSLPVMDRGVTMLAKSGKAEAAIAPGEQRVTGTVFASFRLITP